MPRKKKPSRLSLFKKNPATRKARRKNPDDAPAPRTYARRNPPLKTDLVQFLGPAVGAYAVTRFTGRGLHLFGSRWPAFQKHLRPLGNLLAFAAAWLASHKWKRLEKYHTPIVVGSGLALIQSLVQTYLPGLAWLLDAEPARAVLAFPATAPSPTGAVNGFRRRPRVRYVSPGELSSAEVEEMHEEAQAAAPEAQAAAPEEPEPGEEEAMLADLLGDDEEMADLYGGVFKN